MLKNGGCIWFPTVILRVVYTVDNHALSRILSWLFTLKTATKKDIYQGTLNTIHMEIRAQRFAKTESNIAMQGHLGSLV